MQNNYPQFQEIIYPASQVISFPPQQSNVQQVPPNIMFGKEYSESTKFDDKYPLSSQHYSYKLYSITVAADSKYVIGIGFKYLCQDGAIVETRHNLFNYTLTKLYYGAQETEFIIGDDDFLKTIKVKHGDWIDRIEFETYLGKNRNFGGKGGNVELTFNFPGYTFSVASGGYRQFLDFVNFSVVPLPDYFLQKLVGQKHTAQIQYPSQFQNQPMDLMSQYQYQQQTSYQSQYIQYPRQIEQTEQQPNYDYPPMS